jgi:hypothetical protein
LFGVVAIAGSNGSNREDASSRRASVDARCAARWISCSSSALVGLLPADSSRNSVLMWMTVSRLFSSWATELAVFAASSRREFFGRALALLAMG